MHTARIQITSYRILVKTNTKDLFPEVHRVRFNAFCPDKREVIFIHYNELGETEKLVYELDSLNYKFDLKLREVLTHLNNCDIRLLSTNDRLIGFQSEELDTVYMLDKNHNFIKLLEIKKYNSTEKLNYSLVDNNKGLFV